MHTEPTPSGLAAVPGGAVGNLNLSTSSKAMLTVIVGVAVAVVTFAWFGSASAQAPSTYLAAFSINGGNGVMSGNGLSMEYAFGQSQPVGTISSATYSLESGSVPVMRQNYASTPVPTPTPTPTPLVATKLVYTTQPGSATEGYSFNTQPVVTVQDGLGNTVTSSTAQVTLSITPGSGTTGQSFQAPRPLLQ